MNCPILLHDKFDGASTWGDSNTLLVHRKSPWYDPVNAWYPKNRYSLLSNI